MVRRLTPETAGYPAAAVDIARDFGNISASKARLPRILGITVDGALSRRFDRLGFPLLAEFCAHNSRVAARVRHALEWIAYSRRERYTSAAVVKTSVGLEFLLSCQPTEPLRRVLSERMALILSPDAARREQVYATIRDFYDVRSNVVHGRGVPESEGLKVNAVDGLVVLTALVIAANRDWWEKDDGIPSWCDRERWTVSACHRPGPVSALLARALRERHGRAAK
jgi:hypothetical protein